MKELSSSQPLDSQQAGRRATIYDVADKAGVSITTVSRFLNDTDSVKESTAARIAEAMTTLDYVPQGNTGSRANHKVGRIGVLTPFFPAPSFVARLQGMMPVFRDHNYEMVVYTIENEEQLDEYLTSVPFTRRLDGLVLMSMRLSEEQHRTLAASGLHVVMVESDDENYSRVLADDRQGGHVAARYFLAKGYFPCAFIGDIDYGISYSLRPSDLRLRGFKEVLEAAGKGQDLIELEGENSAEGSLIVIKKHIAEHGPPRAVFAMSDLLAIGVLKAAKELGLRVPEDLAVLGFDDIEAADWMDLSTITQHLTDSGRIAAGLLLDKIAGKGVAIQKVNLQVSLVERSTA